MRILFHPEFPGDLRKFKAEYSEISPRLGEQFRQDVDNAIEAIKAAPEAAGHYLELDRSVPVIRSLRRHNLRSFRSSSCTESHPKH